ncbi:MAG TPA: class I SAM-dependent methyltransferase [Sedimenticola sp.]|nr:class I SAM-dependent methyltransferase [Sedimenticola sp.]
MRRRWDRRHAEAPGAGGVPRVLAENLHLLPGSGEALDLACGRGAGALKLAEAGLRVTAWDLSPVAVERVAGLAGERGLQVTAGVRDVIAEPPPPGRFDVILVSYFLARDLCPALSAALRPGGLLFYQTFSREAVTTTGPSNPDYRLADNELLQLFPSLKVRVYREEGRLGDTSRGCRDIAMLVAERQPGWPEGQPTRC